MRPLALLLLAALPACWAADRVVVKTVSPNNGACTEPAQAGDKLTVQYTGKLTDGTTFDTSVGKSPFAFTLGAGQVIKGWDEGMTGMCVNEERILTIPPSLGYGDAGMPPSIPAKATLVFDVLLTALDRGD